MWQAKISPPAEIVKPVADALNRFEDRIRNKALRAGVVAAGKPIQQVFAQLASRYRSDDDPPTRKIRGTDVYVARPHLADSIRNKVWKASNNEGYVNYVGPVSIEVPHARWFERGTAQRQTKTGQNRGRMPAYHLLSRTASQAEPLAYTAFANEMKAQIESIGR